MPAPGISWRAPLLVGLVLGACSGARPLQLPTNWDDRLLSRPVDHPRIMVAVMPFATSPSAAEARLDMAEVVTTSLVRTGQFEVIERARLDTVFAEQRMKVSGAVDDSSAVAELGQLLGAEAVISGTVSSATQQRFDRFAYDALETVVRLDARAIDTTTGAVLFAESAEGKSVATTVTTARGEVISGAVDTHAEFARAAAAAGDIIGRRLGRQFPVVGYVVAVNAAGATLDLGHDRGVQEGDLLVALRKGNPIIHPVTHAEIGREKQLLGRLLVESVTRGTSRATQVESGMPPLQPGDIVVLTTTH